ncbi:MAG: NusG domain II-containing protein [Clostridia bacterium]|nr:NusG domain II-containing protein [Clostridia bacterium]
MKSKETAKKHRIRNDVILIVSILLVASLALAYLFIFRDRGDMVKVTVDGEFYKEYSLSQDITEDIRMGENLNRLIIEDGKAYVEMATCPDGICVDHSPIYRNGQSIVCLPNRVVITVVKGDNTPDAVI